MTDRRHLFLATRHSFAGNQICAARDTGPEIARGWNLSVETGTGRQSPPIGTFLQILGTAPFSRETGMSLPEHIAGRDGVRSDDGHGLANEPREAIRERERPSPTLFPRSPEVQGRSGRSSDELKRRSPICGSAMAPATRLSGYRETDPASQHLDEEHFVVSGESATPWPGRSRAASLTMRCKIASSHPPSSVGFRSSTDGRRIPTRYPARASPR